MENSISSTMCRKLVTVHLQPSLFFVVTGSDVNVVMMKSCLSVSSVVAQYILIIVFVTGVGMIDGERAMQPGKLQRMSNSHTGMLLGDCIRCDRP